MLMMWFEFLFFISPDLSSSVNVLGGFCDPMNSCSLIEFYNHRDVALQKNMQHNMDNQKLAMRMC